MRASLNKHLMKWMVARMTPPLRIISVESVVPVRPAPDSAAPVPPLPSAAAAEPEAISSDGPLEGLRTRKRSLKQKQPMAPPAPQGPSEPNPSDVALLSSMFVAGVCSGDDVPRQQRSSPSLNGTLGQILPTKEEASRKRTLPGICDSMSLNMAKLWADQRELAVRLPNLCRRYGEMQRRGNECEAEKLEQARAESASLGVRLAELQAKLEESERRRMRAEEKGAEETARRELMAAEVETAKAELASYRAGEEGRWENLKKAFMKSEEFYNIVGARSASMLGYGFDGAIRQIQEAGYLPAGAPPAFLSLRKVADSIPDDQIDD
ncbi:ribonuclease Y-like [Zingiber officinale]|uniref:ribonuclease Y-like n=1 Tax=Zingiber officinale TaxID=94328 RepID=UPI001C4AFFD5|nr:ribonuclease Y-like [Zingiber officinale]